MFMYVMVRLTSDDVSPPGLSLSILCNIAQYSTTQGIILKHIETIEWRN